MPQTSKIDVSTVTFKVEMIKVRYLEQSNFSNNESYLHKRFNWVVWMPYQPKTITFVHYTIEWP